MRILWSSNAPWAFSGYATQTRATVPQLQALGHELAIAAFFGLQGGILNWNDVPIYPSMYHRYGQDAIAPHAAHFKADLMISLMDIWVCEPDRYPNTRWCPWFPIDHEPMPECVAAKAARAFYPITMSQFGKAMCDRIGLETGYVPHAIDTTVFTPMDRQEARAITGLPDDRFIVGMVAANKGIPSRKAFPQQLEAFARFQQGHPDALLYLHTSTGERETDGVNLIDLCESLALRVGHDVLFVDQYGYRMGAPDEQMAALYSSFDVLMSASLGEGFGIPILEAQACGTPVIVGAWTAMEELCFPGSIAIPKADATKMYTGLASYQWSVHPEALADALDQMWQRPPTREPLRHAALAYDSALVRETHWKPTLAEIGRRMMERDQLHAQRNGVHV